MWSKRSHAEGRKTGASPLLLQSESLHRLEHLLVPPVWVTVRRCRATRYARSPPNWRGAGCAHCWGGGDSDPRNARGDRETHYAMQKRTAQDPFAGPIARGPSRCNSDPQRLAALRQMAAVQRLQRQWCCSDGLCRRAAATCWVHVRCPTTPGSRAQRVSSVRMSGPPLFSLHTHGGKANVGTQQDATRGDHD